MKRLALAALLLTGCWKFRDIVDARCDSGTLEGCPSSSGGGSTGGGGGTGGGGTGGGAQPPSDAGLSCGASRCVYDGGPSICYGGWCWQNPLPQGNDLTSVWGSGASDVWASGTAGTLMHYDGSTWTSFQGELPVDATVSVWGWSSNLLWAVSAATAPHRWDGTKWQPEVLSDPTAKLTAISGDDAGQIVAVGVGGAVAWRSPTQDWVVSRPLDDGMGSTHGTVVAFDPFGTCWAITEGMRPGIQTCDGGSPFPVPNDVRLAGLAATGSGDVWAAGGSTIDGAGSLLRHPAGANGNVWEDLIDGGDPLFSVTALPSDEVLVGANNFVLRAPSRVEIAIEGRVRALWTRGNIAWAVGVGGEMIQSSSPPTNWSPYVVSRRAAVGPWVALPNALYAVNQSGAFIVRTTSGTWQSVGVSGANTDLYDVWVSADAGYGVTMDQVQVYESPDPRRPESYDASVPFSDGVAVWGSSPDDVWVLGRDGKTIHRTSGGWGPGFDAGYELLDVDGAGTTRAFMVGPFGSALRRVDATTWAPDPVVDLPPPDLEAVWVPTEDGGTEAIAAGLGGIYRRANGIWTRLNPTPVDVTWHAIFGWDENDYYVVGDFGHVLHVRNGVPQPIEVGTRNNLFSVVGRVIGGQRELWIGGAEGTILRATVP